MNVTKEIFNNLHTSADLIDSFGKRYQINENDHTYRWLMINEVDPYLVFLRIFQLAKTCAVVKIAGVSILQLIILKIHF